MLEELVSLEDGQEVDRLVEDAQGRRLFNQVRKTTVLEIPQGDNTLVDCPTQLICTWIFICCVP